MSPRRSDISSGSRTRGRAGDVDPRLLDRGWASGLPDLSAGAWVCPITGDPLTMVLCCGTGFGVLTDEQGSAGRCWPVVDGIPFLRLDRLETVEAVVDAVAAGRTAEARRLLFLEPREADDLPFGLHDSQTSKARLRLISQILEQHRRRANEPFARDAIDELIAAFGFSPDDLLVQEHDDDSEEGIAASGLLALHPVTSGPVVHFGCGLGALVRRVAAHGRETIGIDRDWTLLWIARHLMGLHQPLACRERETADAGFRFTLQRPMTIVVGSRAGSTSLVATRLRSLHSVVAPGGQVLVPTAASRTLLAASAAVGSSMRLSAFDRDAFVASVLEFRVPPLHAAVNGALGMTGGEVRVDSAGNAIAQTTSPPTDAEAAAINATLAERLQQAVDEQRTPANVSDEATSGSVAGQPVLVGPGKEQPPGGHDLQPPAGEIEQEDEIEEVSEPRSPRAATDSDAEPAGTEPNASTSADSSTQAAEQVEVASDDDPLLTYALRLAGTDRSPDWSLMLPPEGTPLKVNPLYRRWQSDPTVATAAALTWHRDDLPDDWSDEAAASGNWAAGSTDIIELARRRLLVADVE